MKGLEVLEAALRRAEVEVVFGMLGASNVPWVGHAVAHGAVRLVKLRHEEGAVNAAVGYARATGKVGICTVTRGPGFANTINALIAATRTHVPIVMLTGQSPSPNPMTTQNVEQQKFTELAGADYSHADSADDLPGAFFRAVRRALDTGIPQVLSIAESTFGEEATLPLPDFPTPASAEPDPGVIDLAVAALGRSLRPLVVAGQGAVLAGCRDDLVALADLVGADVATSVMANRFFSGHPRDLGVSGGWAIPASHRHLIGRDVILSVGATANRFTMDMGRISGEATLIRCDIDPAMSGSVREPDISLVGDAARTVRALTEAWIRAGHPPRHQAELPALDELRRSVLDFDLQHDPRRGLDIRDVLLAVDRRLPRDRIIVTDSGRTVGIVSALTNAQDARSWLVGRGYGSVGLGLGTAVGAAVAHPDRRVALIGGDGGFMMGLAALDTARIHELDNLVVVILNDGQYGSETKYLKNFGLPMDVIRQPLPDIPKLAAAFGGTGVVVADPQQLADLTIPDRGLFLIDARLDPHVDPLRAVAKAPDLIGGAARV